MQIEYVKIAHIKTIILKCKNNNCINHEVKMSKMSRRESVKL